MPLTIEQYDRAEGAALSRIGYAQHAAISTKTFTDYGFPVRMTDPAQLVRYIDFFVGARLDTLRPEQFYRGSSIETNYSEDEAALLIKIGDGVRAITGQMCDKPYAVHFNHLNAMGLFRVVQEIAGKYGREKLSIFEVGPGCGYTGALLGTLGHDYMSYDITQGYYIWQSLLLEHFFGCEFTELAGAEDAALSARARIAHMPWWVFLDLFKGQPVAADVVISSANLGEMHLFSLRYVLRTARQMLAGSDVGLLVFADMGAQHLNTHEIIEDELGRAGFRQVISANVFAYALDGASVSQDLVDSLEAEIPLFNPSGRQTTMGADQFVTFRESELPEELKFYAYVSDWPDFIGE